ncbi:translocation/assembly module TamB [Flavobacterium jejuense]|uniref:Translocation/assembly module TamB n=1 Tax=Flavobacterium jejuense TaxID=1544455 RepID=A0ABX0IYV4_9FLAO|nr:translocation/assembly module TamB domain-containing protein [Flavobacterium jejuense]NHN26895.1 translocation/assembly module TamB [Flavobacterium jejuense]
MKKKFKKYLKIILWIISSILGLFFLLIIALQIPFVQNFVKDKAVSYLSNKIQTNVAIGSIEIGLPKKIIINDFYFEDQTGDTLVAGKKLDVDISLFKLISNSVEINHVYLEGITAKINKNKDSLFNFDYIIEAFANKNETSTSEPMVIDINQIKIKKSKFYYKDVVSKNDLDVTINYFETEFNTFDLNNLAFDIPKIQLDGLQLNLNQGLVETTTKVKENIKNQTKAKILDLKLNEINLTKIAVSYKNETSKLNTNIAFEKLKTTVKNIDLKNQKIEINDLILEDTYGKLALGKLDQKIVETKSETTNSNWNLSVNTISFSNINLDYDNNTFEVHKKSLDPNHLSVTQLNFKANDLTYTTTKSSGIITSFNFLEKNGFILNNLSTQFEYAEQNAFLKNLNIITPQTHLKNENIALKYTSIASLTKNPENIQLQANFSNSSIGFKDILLLVPDLATTSPFDQYKNSIVNFTANVNGKLSNLQIKTFKISGIGATKIDLKGSILGLPNVDQTYIDLIISTIESTSKDIANLIPKGSIPNTITLPEHFIANGNFKGYITNFETKLNLKSSYGNAIVDASLNLSKPNHEAYNIITSLDQFNIGKLIQNKDLGTVSLNTTIKGNSFDPKKANAKIEMEILSANYNQYNYNSIILNGTIKEGNFNVFSKATDPNLTFNLNTSGDFGRETPKAKLNLKIDLIDLNKLNLYANALKLKGDINADFDTLDLENLNGNLSVTNFLVALEQEQFPIDTLTLRAVSSAEKDSIILKSQFANATINGNYNLATISNALTNSFSKYLNTNSNSGNKTPSEPQHLTFEINIKEEEIIKKIVPDLKEMSAISISGNYNSANDSIVVNASVPNLNYAGNQITAGNFSITTKNEALIYNLNVAKIQNNAFIVPKTKISGKIENNQIDYQVSIIDLKEVEKYAISGNYLVKNELSEINLNPEKLVLNYENWTIDSDNSIQMSQSGINIKNFNLSKNQNSITIQSKSDDFSAPIEVNLKDFKLQSITNIVSSNYEFGGTVTGNTTIENLNKSPLFIADLAIENFTIKKDTVGNMALKIDNKIANTYTVDLGLTGNDNKVKVIGDYKTGSEILNFNINLQKLKMSSLQAFTLGNLKDSEGYLNGKLQVAGKASNPNIDGNIQFNQVGFNLIPLNSKFKLINDKIIFNHNEIVFNDFKLKDENDNNLKINGTINSSDYSNLGFNLNIVAENFKAVNSEAKNNDLFYGQLYLDNSINIKGNLNNPVVNGNIKINKDTKFTIVLPQEDPSIADRKGIVEFIDQDQPVLITVEDPMKKITETSIKGINASVNIEIDKEAEISIIIDKTNGDFLKLKGEAKLNGGIDASGKTTLTGKYEFTDGSYEMSFNLIKRKFDIKPGSYILWTGEPTTANVEITAIYKSEIAPIDLVNDQLGNVSTETRNTYKQKIPFETQLKMTGELMTPEINFDIVLPDGNNDVSTEVINTTKAKLEQIRQQDDVLNKQVFAVLLLNRFIGENPFQSESGGLSATNLAKQSASRILSEQLNQLAGDLVKGFEIDFDLEATEDYSSGQKQDRTDLNVGISKELLDDRLKVTVGSSFGIEGSQNENEQANNIAGDVTAEYLITKDGRYKLKAYRKNNYQVALQGQVIETGVAFIITMNYDKFKELFQKKATKKQ